MKFGEKMSIEKEWKETCRILLSQEIGEFDEYLPYLQKFIGPALRHFIPHNSN